MKKTIVFILSFLALFIFVGCKKTNHEKIVDEALSSIMLGDVNSLSQSFDLIAKTGQHELEITWTLENTQGETASLDLTGEKPRVIITPEEYAEDEQGNATNQWGKAELTATVTSGDKTASRKWELNIKPQEKSVAMTITEVKAASINTVVTVTGTVAYVIDDGFVIVDDTDGIYVYGEPSDENVKPGAVVTLQGSRAIYYTLPQIKDYTVTVDTNAPATGFDYSGAPETSVSTVADWDPTETTGFAQIVKISGRVDQTDKAKDPKGDQVYVLRDELTQKEVMLFYESNEQFLTELAAKKGDYVSLVAITYDNHSSYNSWRLLGFPGSIEDASAPTLDDEDKVEIVKEALEEEFEGMEVASDLELPANGSFDSALVWVSKNADIIGNDGKIVERPDVDTDVEFEVTITLNDATATATVTVKVKALVKKTIAEVFGEMDEEDVDFVLIEGVIIGEEDRYGNYLVADETAAIYVRHKLEDDDLEVGDKVRIIGKATVYNRNNEYTRQINGNYSVEKVDDQKHENPLTATVVAIEDLQLANEGSSITATTLEAIQAEENYGKFVSVTGVVIKVASGNYTNYYLAESAEEGADRVYLHHFFPRFYDLYKTVVGTEVTVLGLIYGYHTSNGGWMLGPVEVELSDQQKEDYVKEVIEEVLEDEINVSASLEFITEADSLEFVGNPTIAYSSNKPEIIANDGTFVAPSEDTEVTITVTVTFSDTHTKTFVYTVTAKATTPGGEVVEQLLYSYDFSDGGSSGNNAYASTNLETKVSYASDNPGGTTGTTTWIADYANLSLTNGTRLGGKLVSTEYGSPNANIRTDFAYNQIITKVEITGVTTFGTAGNVGNIYLQVSNDGTTWTTVDNKTVSSTIVFDNLNINEGSYIKIVVELTASSKNSGLSFTGIKVTGFPKA